LRLGTHFVSHDRYRIGRRHACINSDCCAFSGPRLKLYLSFVLDASKMAGENHIANVPNGESDELPILIIGSGT
jgi:hypothetical protein